MVLHQRTALFEVITEELSRIANGKHTSQVMFTALTLHFKHKIQILLT